jgi:uncharacterized protein (DUF1800 family)
MATMTVRTDAAALVALIVFGCAACSAGTVRAAAPRQMPSQQQALHVLDRLAYGPAPGDVDRVMKIGVDAYIAEQLRPENIPEPGDLKLRLAALSSQQESAVQLFATAGPPVRRAAGDNQAALDRVKALQDRASDEAREARLLRAIYSPQQLQEKMTEFWFNHFNVFIDKGQEGHIWTGAYEREAIRPYALGRFRDLLLATAQHPAMLYYLDNWQSSAAATGRDGKSRGLNENYAREVMELHTLGVDGGYTQHDVTELARILTGWTYNPQDLAQGQGPAFHFAPKRHDSGAKIFLGVQFPAGGGEEEGERALDMLASSPATARHIAYELAQYFVADQPPPRLVGVLANRFRETGGDIRATLLTLFQSPEFWDPQYVGNRFKTPYQFVVSSVRVAGLPQILNVRPLLNALYQNGEPLYGCLTPDGYKLTQAAWLNPDTMIYRLNFVNALGNGNLPLWQPQAPPAAPAPAPGNIAVLNKTDAGMMVTEMAPPPPPAAPQPAAPKPPPPDPFGIQAALGNAFSLATAEALADARPQMRAALMLGSPEFMQY